jgi:hypothetical protein
MKVKKNYGGSMGKYGNEVTLCEFLRRRGV